MEYLTDVSLTASVSYRSEVVDLRSRAVYVSSLGSEIYRRDRKSYITKYHNNNN